jgi:polysaccharide export outer membrane protein/exopolysaccharide production protein ExoF
MFSISDRKKGAAMIITRQKKSSAHRAQLGACVAAIALALFITPAIADSASGYKLGPLDKIRLRVQEWRASKDEVYEWAALKENYIVGPSGMVSIPLAGDIRAAGRTSEELSKAIGQRLKERFGMIEAPDTAVEIVQYRPFYITGQVDKPGEYPYRPNLTVLQAISVAGGMQRVNDMGLFRLGRDSISSRGELAVIQSQTRNMLARKARLEAELSSAAKITFPKELADRSSDPAVNMLLDQEKTIFETRRRALDSQLTALEHLKSYLNKEVESLNAQVQTETTQMDLVNKELSSISALVERGLSSAPRQLLLQRTIAQIEGERLRLQTSVVKAQQDISKTDIEIVDVRNKWNNEVTVELRATQASLEELKDKAETASKLIYESEITAPQFIHDRMSSRKLQPILKIVRETNGVVSEIFAGETTQVLPGDTIKVEMPITVDKTLDLSSKGAGADADGTAVLSTQ